MISVVFGASGGLATALGDALLARGGRVNLVARQAKRDRVERHFEAALAGGGARLFTVEHRYSEFEAAQAYDSYFFTQALFSPAALTTMEDAAIPAEIEVGLTEPIRLTRKLLAQHPPAAGERRNYCFIGSTSSYAGFRNTSVYCAVKHGLLGFVRAMNDEYSATDTRFWLFSMGTMNTEMGALLVEQDPESFLQPQDVAGRIVEAISSPSNVFEPEVVMRRRTIRFRPK